jgi:serine/threonine-protein kinase
MTPERDQQIDELCREAMERPPAQRSSFLEAACAGDPHLRRDVELRLPARGRPESLVESPPETASPTLGSQPTHLSPRRALAHYQLRSLLGQGGMGEVYLAEDPRLGRSVAIKLLAPHLVRDQAAKARFIREARAASKLDHPNIGTIYDIGEQDGELFLVLAHYQGETLNQRLERGPLPVDEAVEILRQLALGLEAAHRAGIVHRDIKPANVLVTNSGTAKILDFGLAKLLSDSHGPNMTEAGQVMGTPLYMSPEQLRGEAIDARTDLWSLGVLAYELLSGVSPFRTASKEGIPSRILRDEPASLRSVPGVPEWLVELVSQLLRKNPAERPQSASEVLGRLQDRNRDGRTSTQPPLPRKTMLAVGGLVLAGVLTLGSWFALNRGGGSIDSLAVLPFTNASGDPNTEYLSDGISESLINSLAEVRGLRIVPRSSVFRYKGKVADTQKIGRELQVRAVLTGRLLRRGDTLNVQTELVDVDRGSQLWGTQYNRKLADIISVQEEISREISQNLRLRLTGEEKQRLTKRYTQDSQAYQLYLKGRYFWDKRSPDALESAIEYFQQAIHQDPNYALAYVGLADAYAVLALFGERDPRLVMPKAKAAALKALEMDDGLGEAHVSLGWVSYSYDWDWPTAGKHFERALALKPAYPPAHYLYSLYLMAQGRFDDGLAEARRAVELDPLSLAARHYLEVQLFIGGRVDESIEECRRTLELDPGYAVSHAQLGQSYAEKGMYPEALAAFEKYSALSRGSPMSLAFLGYIHARTGDRAFALGVLDKLKALSKERYVSGMWFGLVYVGLGEKDEAFRSLETAYQEHANFLAYLRVLPWWRPLRSDSRFADLQRRIGPLQ